MCKKLITVWRETDSHKKIRHPRYSNWTIFRMHIKTTKQNGSTKLFEIKIVTRILISLNMPSGLNEFMSLLPSQTFSIALLYGYSQPSQTINNLLSSWRLIEVYHYVLKGLCNIFLACTKNHLNRRMIRWIRGWRINLKIVKCWCLFWILR